MSQMSVILKTPKSIVLTNLMMLLIAIAGCGDREYAWDPLRIDSDAPTEHSTTKSGLKYKVLRKGSGDFPLDGDKVWTHFKLSLTDGTVIDNSYRMGFASEFEVGDKSHPVGFNEGMKLIAEGGMIELVMPPELGYGDTSTGAIPGGSTIIYQIELIKIR